MMNISLANASTANPYNGPTPKQIDDFWNATNCVERDVCQYIFTQGFSSVDTCSSYDFAINNNDNGRGNYYINAGEKNPLLPNS